MACSLTTGRKVPCKSAVGGIKTIYFADYGTLGDATIVAGEITVLAGTPDFFQFDVKGASSLETAINSSRENGTTFYESTLTMALTFQDKATQEELKLIAHGRPHVLDQIDNQAIVQAAEDAVARGELVATDCGWNTERPNILGWLHKGGKNASHVHHLNGRDSEGRSAIEVEGRKSLLRLYRFLRKQPGFSGFRFEFVAPETGVRETATVVGKKTVTVDDYMSGRAWDDAVCWTFYNIDLHVSDARGNYGGQLERGVVPTIPRGALLPAGTKRFAVAGRCLSSDREANSAMRVEAPCMAMGQAMGANAALAAEAGLDDLEAVPMGDLRQLLHEHGAMVPGDIRDVAESVAQRRGKPRA